MKHSIFPAILLAFSISFSSCDSFLTEEARGVENLDTYFLNADEVDSFVTGCYFTITYGGWWQVYNPWLMFDMATDDLWMGNTTQTPDYTSIVFFQPDAPSSGPLSNFWQYRYKAIANCNEGIARIPGTPMDSKLRDIRLAEVRFLRAYFYFELVKNFGGVPLLTEFLTPDRIEKIGRASESEVYDFIEKELSEVAAVLPDRNGWGSADTGRATSGAALGLLGKALLYQGKWEEAREVLAKVIESKAYSLLPSFGDVWSPAFNNSAESLFEAQTMYNGDLYSTGGSLTVVTGCRNGVGDGWSWGQPTSDLENAFLAAGDHERLRWTIIKTACTEIAGEDRFNEFIINNLKTFDKDASTVGDWNDPLQYAASLERALANVSFREYEQRFGWTSETMTSGYIIDPSQHKSARIIRKFFLPLSQRPEIYNIDKIPLNHRILRYADVLLMYAEACCESGLDADARIALNEVRARVGLPDVTASGAALREAIRSERRLELACEHQRLYDIRRWTAPDGRKVIENLFGPDGSFVKYNLGPDADMYEAYNQKESSSKGQRFQAPRDLLFPIPLYEIQNSNGVVSQNPGW